MKKVYSDQTQLIGEMRECMNDKMNNNSSRGKHK